MVEQRNVVPIVVDSRLMRLQISELLLSVLNVSIEQKSMHAENLITIRNQRRNNMIPGQSRYRYPVYARSDEETTVRDRPD